MMRTARTPPERSSIGALHAPLYGHLVIIDVDPLDDEDKIGEGCN
jgi:hypothetical protein